MGIVGLIRSEIKKLFSTKTFIFTLIGLLLIPIVYAAILLSAKWGPYDYMDHLPVAVVNNDKGAVSDGEEINVGNDLVNTLKESNTLGWDFVSKEAAQRGLDRNKYYMVIEIPEDFSQKVTTVLDEKPQVPEIRYLRNEGMNFMASQVTNSAVERIREQLGDKITATFATKVFKRFPDIADGFLSLADGAKQIKDGTIQLAEGTDTMLSSLQEKAPDINRLAEGAKTAKDGANTLHSSVKEGTGSINQLNSGANTLASKVQGGTSSIKALNDGASTLATKVQGGTSSIDALNSGASTIAKKVSEGTKGIDELKTGANTLATKVSGGTKGIDELKAGANTLATKVSDGTKGIDELKAGANTLATKVSEGTKGIDELKAGANTLATKVSEGTDGIDQLKDGAGKIEDGISELNRQVQGRLDAISGNNALQTTIENLAFDVVTVSMTLDSLSIDPIISTNKNASLFLNNLDAYLDSRLNDPTISAEEKAKVEELQGTAQALSGGLNQIASNLEEKNDDINNAKNKAKNLYTNSTSPPSASGHLKNTIDGVSAFKQQVLEGLTAIKYATDGKSNDAADDYGKNDLLLGAQKLSGGTVSLKDSWSDLIDGTKQLSDGTDSLKDSWTELAGGTKQLSDGTDSLKDSWTELAGGTKQLSDGTDSLKSSWTELAGGTKKLSDGTNSLKTSWSELVNGTKQLSDGTNTLKGSWTELTNGTKQLSGGTNTLRGSWTELTNGTKLLSNGTNSLVTSWNRLSNGTGSLASGLNQIASGNETVANGWNNLIDGTTQLNEGAGKLRDGSDELATGLDGGYEQVSTVKVTDDNINMFASPVKVSGEDVNAYEYYRDSTAPYVLSLALFVTLLISSFFIDFKKPAATPASAISWFLSKWVTLALFAIVEAVIVSLFVLLGLKLSVENVGLFILFAILASITFMSIILFFVSIGQYVGRFLALAFIVLQLSITGANLPIPMLPDNLQALGKFLPLTYSNTGFKAAISLGDVSLIAQNATVLVVYLIVTSLFALAIYLFNFKSIKAPEVQAEL